MNGTWSCGGELQACVRRVAARFRPWLRDGLLGLRLPRVSAELASTFRPRDKRGDGAPQGAFRLMSAEAAARLATRPPSGAPFVAISVPGSAFPGTRPFRPVPVQRAPRGGVVVPPDRCPGASRVRGYEPRPRAPPLLPFQQRPAGTPLGGKGERNISLVGEDVKRKDTGLEDAAPSSAGDAAADRKRQRA